MVFEFEAAPSGGWLGAFAAASGGSLAAGVLTLPDALGTGTIRGYALGASLRLLVHQYTLQEELVFRRIGNPDADTGVVLTYYDAFGDGPRQSGVVPSVQVHSSDLPFETRFPAGVPVRVLLLAAERTLLVDLLAGQAEHPLLQNIVAGNGAFLYEELLSDRMRHAAAALAEGATPGPLPDFQRRLWVEELLYCFFTALLQRPAAAPRPVHPADVARIYRVRDALVADLSAPPGLPALARAGGLSERTLKRLFRQVFGSSVYAYYQARRMDAAARLLREERCTVAEAGYALGFANLSHFARLFARHAGMTPKKYAQTTARAGSTPAER